jgi:hypothetical protein
MLGPGDISPHGNLRRCLATPTESQAIDITQFHFGSDTKPSKQMVWIYSFSLVRTETFSTVYNPKKIRLRPRSDYARSLKHAFSLFSPGAGLRFRLLVGSVSDSAFDPGLRRELVAPGFESASPSERVGKFLVATPLKRLSHCLKRLWSALTLLTCR